MIANSATLNSGAEQTNRRRERQIIHKFLAFTMTAFVSKVSDSSVSRYISPIETFVTRIELIVHFKLGKFTTKCCVINLAKSPPKI